MNGDAKPRVGRACGKKIPNDVTRNSKRKPARNHGVDPNHAATNVGKRSARIARRQADVSLYPGSSAVFAQRANRMNHAGRDGADETQGIADGYDKLAGANLR